MEISLKSNIKEVTKRLNHTQRKQLPFAISQALTDTAFDARKAVQVQLPRKLKAPTPWTIRGVMVQKAKKTSLTSRVYFRSDRAAYMKYQVHGGRRKPRGRAIPMPVGIKLNKYGNMSRGALQALIAKPETFVGIINGTSGVWDRRNGRLLVAWKSEADYQPRFPFNKIVSGVVRSKFSRHFRRRLRNALKTAR